MLDPAWPKRIVFGQARGTLRNGRQTGIYEGELAQGFRPGTETSKNVPRRPLRPRLYERPTDHPAADPRPAGIRPRRGWTIALQVKEVGSGASERQLREKFLEAARRREIDVVLVWRLDRWGRSVADLLATLQELQH